MKHVSMWLMILAVVVLGVAVIDSITTNSLVSFILCFLWGFADGMIGQKIFYHVTGERLWPTNK